MQPPRPVYWMLNLVSGLGFIMVVALGEGNHHSPELDRKEYCRRNHSLSLTVGSPLFFKAAFKGFYAGSECVAKRPVAAQSWAFRLALCSSWLNHPLPEGAAGISLTFLPITQCLNVCVPAALWRQSSLQL